MDLADIRAGTTVADIGAGDFDIEVGFKGITKRFKMRAPDKTGGGPSRATIPCCGAMPSASAPDGISTATTGALHRFKS